jgi:hypothetical protein
MNEFWAGFEKRAAKEKRDNKGLLYAGLGLGALASGIAGRKIYSKYFKAFKDARPNLDMWHTQGKFHSGRREGISHMYDAVKGGTICIAEAQKPQYKAIQVSRAVGYP